MLGLAMEFLHGLHIYNPYPYVLCHIGKVIGDLATRSGRS
jgi:hypothetical protein